MNSDHRIGLRAKKAAEEVNRLRGWKRTEDRSEENKTHRTGLHLFARQVDAATTFAQNCGGCGSAPDQNWEPDKNEDDILWARRCFRKAREMVTTLVIRRGMRR